MRRRALLSAGVVGIFTLLSRIFGLIRDMVMANVLGASASADAFYVAFRIPNTFRRFFAEGAMTVSFVPVFTEVYEKNGKDEAKWLSSSVFTLLLLTLLIVSALGVFFSPLLTMIFAPGFVAKKKLFALAVDLLRIMFPYLLLISIVALFAGVLNSMKHFGAPAFSPVLLNLSMIIAGIAFASGKHEPSYTIAISVVLGGIAQVLIQIPFLAKKEMIPYFTFRIHPSATEILRLLIPAVFSAAVYQLNILVTTVFASFLEKGSVSYLYYAGRFIEFPLGILIFPLTNVILPELSSYVARGEFDEARGALKRGINIALFLTLPSSLGLILLSKEIIFIFLKGGRFQTTDVIETSYALVLYSIGIIPVALSRLWVQSYYSLKDFKTPALLSLLSFLLNAELAIVLMEPLRHGGLALATSISSAFYAYLLARLSPTPFEFDYREFLKSLLGTLSMGVAIFAFKWYFPFNPSLGKVYWVKILVAELVIGVAFYFLSMRALSSSTMDTLLRIFKR